MHGRDLGESSIGASRRPRSSGAVALTVAVRSVLLTPTLPRRFLAKIVKLRLLYLRGLRSISRSPRYTPYPSGSSGGALSRARCLIIRIQKGQPVTGPEVAAAAKALEVVGKKALDHDQETKAQLVEAAKDSPEMKAAARSMAARVAVKERIKLRLYQPFARMIGVSKTYFEDRFPEEMEEKLADIPEENLVTPPASVAVPALQGLSYSFEEEHLREMYLNLIAAASDSRRRGDSHPAFSEVIKQLSSAEAKILNDVLQGRGDGTIVQVRYVNPENHAYVVVKNHLLNLWNTNTGVPEEIREMPTWVDNWVRLGLVSVSYEASRARAGAYDWVAERPEYLQVPEEAPVGEPNESAVMKREITNGVLDVTAFGQRFIKVVSEPPRAKQ